MPRPQVPSAATLPVARVCVDVAPTHLDRVFEYLVPAELDEVAVPGARVRVSFSGRDTAGWLLGRTGTPDHQGPLGSLRKVVSAEPVLSPQVAALARRVADRYAGTLADVLRLAVPPRHARTEKEQWPDPEPTAPPDPRTEAWAPYRGGEAFCRHLRDGAGPRAVWTALPAAVEQDGRTTSSWASAVAQAVASCVLGGRRALVVVPDSRDVRTVSRALDEVGLGPWSPGMRGGTVCLEAGDGPTRRYRSFLAASRGAADVVVGTRAAAFAPVPDLGLAVCWDDGDDLHAEPRAPYPHVREVLALRSEQTRCGLLLGACSRSVPAQALVERGWAQPVAADRAAVRARTPRVRALTSDELARHGPAGAARLPSPVFSIVREALATGPVLVQVPRAGYQPVLACARCREPATCTACHGPLGRDRVDDSLRCSWCGHLAASWSCDACGGQAVRAVRVGSERTAEELGRAFPNVQVRTSGRPQVLVDVPGTPALVVCTPGAEPPAQTGYAAAVLLDASAGSALRDEAEVLRRWLAAAALVRADGQVAVVGDGPPRPTQALVRWDPAWLAATDLAERTELGLPPAVRVATVTGTRAAVERVVDRIDVPGLTVLGPVPASDDEVRTMLRTSVRHGPQLSAALWASLGVRSTRKEPGDVRARVDPPDLR